MTQPYALPEPPDLPKSAPDGSIVELARVWISPEGPAIMCRPAFDDPKVMGEMLAELCWHFALAYEQRGGITQAEAREQLKAGWTQGHLNGEAVASKKVS